MDVHGPNLPTTGYSAPIIGTKKRANPSQILAYDTRDDRMEILSLLKNLSPAKRLEFFAWACSVAVLPGTVSMHPGVSPDTIQLAKKARSCDRANESLTIDIVQSLTHLWINYSLDVGECLARLVLLARGKL